MGQRLTLDGIRLVVWSQERIMFYRIPVRVLKARAYFLGATARPLPGEA